MQTLRSVRRSEKEKKELSPFRSSTLTVESEPERRLVLRGFERQNP